MQKLLDNPKEKKNNKFRSIEDIMKDPAAKSKLNNLVDEAVKFKSKIHDHQESVKVLRDAARNDVMLNPKLFNYYVGAAFNNDYAARKDNLDQLTNLMDAVIGLLPPTHSSFVGDE